jgi:hypothetical protein
MAVAEGLRDRKEQALFETTLPHLDHRPLERRRTKQVRFRA